MPGACLTGNLSHILIDGAFTTYRVGWTSKSAPDITLSNDFSRFLFWGPRVDMFMKTH